MRDCKIVRDLLELYMEKLTSDATNEYIEEHFEECNKCKKKFDKMKEFEIQKNNECRIVHGLLPRYIKRLTNKSTDRYIKKHLKICTKCNYMCSDMSAKLVIEDVEKATFIK